MYKQPVLLIPEKMDDEFEKVSAAWAKKGGSIQKLGKFWIKNEELLNRPIAIYGNQAFSFVLAQIYNVQLVSPDDTFIARLKNTWTKRNVQHKKIIELTKFDFPIFIKPVIPKIFLAGIFNEIIDFQQITKGLPDNEEILISSIVEIEAEARSYIMNGKILDIALYEGVVNLDAGKVFLNKFIESNKSELPIVVVIDIAYNEKLGWFILEFNASWGAGLNNCNAEKIIDCIIGATKNN